MAIDDFEELRVYRAAYRQAMNIFDHSQQWPKEERYALTDQWCGPSPLREPRVNYETDREKNDCSEFG